MIVLAFRTDKPEAELYLYDGRTLELSETWQAHRQLAETIHLKIDELLKKNNMTLDNVAGIICFQGPGSFTGLRIGLTIGNTLAYALGIPIVGTQGETWQKTGLERLEAGETDTVALPFYGAEVHITAQKK